VKQVKKFTAKGEAIRNSRLGGNKPKMGTAAVARENGKKGGRPPASSGALARITERAARELAAKNELPLDVMIDNMNFWRRKAAKFTDDMEAVEDIIKSYAKIAATPESMEKFMALLKERNDLMRKMLAARENSQRCAVDAAPYVHPRFQSIAVQHTGKVTKVVQLAITNPGGRELVFDGTITERTPAATADQSGSVIDGESIELPRTGSDS
jgi:uncharacterized protein YciU (UPF0263 family)